MIRYTITFLSMIIMSHLCAQDFDINLIKKHVYTLADDSMNGRGFGTHGGRVAADYIEQQFITAGLSPWNGKYKHPFINSRMMVKIEGCNIVGWVEGNDPVLKNEYIVIGAHYDHVAYYFRGDSVVVFNGADDNASGTATVIELGRWLVNNKNSIKRSVILVAFDGEESGLIGSSHLVKSNLIPTDRIKVMFSLDMVGMLSKYGGIDLVGNSTLDNGEVLLNNLAAKHNINVKKEGKVIEGQTDTAPFGKKGVPAIHVFTSTVSPYHKPGDDPNLLDYDGMVTIAGFMKDAIVELSNSESLLPDKQFIADVQGKGFRPKFGFKLGVGSSKHDYVDEYFYGKDIPVFNAGLYTTIRLSKRFGLQPEVLYQTSGSEHQWGTLRTHEVVVPVNIRFKLFSAADDMVDNQFFVYMGPYYSYKFSGKVGANSMDFDNDFNREDFGIQFGFGFDVMRVQMLIGSSYSFESVSKTSDIVQQSAVFSLGFRF